MGIFIPIYGLVLLWRQHVPHCVFPYRGSQAKQTVADVEPEDGELSHTFALNNGMHTPNEISQSHSLVHPLLNV